MLGFEGESVEYKREVDHGVVKSIVSFANSGGGTVLVGVDDADRRIVGVDDVDAEMLRLTSLMRDCIRPDILMCVSVSAMELAGRNVIVVNVQQGRSARITLRRRGFARKACTCAADAPACRRATRPSSR